MIGKGKSIAHTGASMAYGWNQEKDAEIIFQQHLYGETPQEITKEFQLLQDQNYNCKKNTLSFVISPTIKDGKKLETRELRQITEKFMRQMKLGERQAIAFVHQDKDHKHIHLYVNRIDFKGQAYNDSFIGKRSQKAAEKVAKELKLTTVKQVQFEKAFDTREVRAEIKRRHDLSMKQFSPTSYDQYIKAMETNGVKIIPTMNNQDKLQGFRFEFKGYNFKGSEIHRQMSMGNIGKSIALNPRAEIFKEGTKKINLLGKVVELSGNIAFKIAKSVIKKTIQKGMGY